MSQRATSVRESPSEQEVKAANESFYLILQLLPLNVRKVLKTHVENIEKVLGPRPEDLEGAPTEDRRGAHWAEKRKAKLGESGAPSADPRLTKPRY